MKRETERVNTAIRITFRGSNAFPIDMLQRDAAWPASEEDSNKIIRTQHAETRRSDGEVEITVRMRREPTIGRWESFGWKLVRAE